ncbi:toprim domain-containing protein [Shewanella sp. 202IG2-18]|uniref:toprim domain-containing protein n=1 Tax=Parashewanella hymeniacidonis TaxID=2807618 RepID=UPI0019619652|nr:toprim domain-containing protein [Parashewanella hymeniacidonis]MBM7070757.1 toprim domain-containing protein [Parashewanella hymeniacidonis]
MRSQLQQEILRRLLSDFDFKKQNSDFLQQGICPNCSERELYTSKQNPWIIRCGRLNKCAYEAHIKELYTDLFSCWSDRFKTEIVQTTGQVINPNAAAEAYMELARGFDNSKLKSWYQQGAYYCNDKKIGTATVKFVLSNGSTWERFIDKPERFGNMKAYFSGKYQGHWWQPPDFSVDKSHGELWLTEGIFDAIALLQVGINAVSVMSCNNFPYKELSMLVERAKSKPALIFAFDRGKAGESFAKKFVNKARALGWKASAALPPEQSLKLDWNDLLQRNRLTREHIKEYRYYGQLLLAKTAIEKGALVYQKTAQLSFPFEFEQVIYWFALDIKKLEKEIGADVGGGNDHLQQVRTIAEASNVQELMKCHPQPLYFQENKLTNESWYYLKIDFPHNNSAVKNTFTGKQLGSASEFKNRLLSVAPGAIFEGKTYQLNRFLAPKIFNIKRVNTIDYVGYVKEQQCYVFNKVAVTNGSIYHLNDEDFFDIEKLSIKTIQRLELTMEIDEKQYDQQWLEYLWQAFGEKGIVALAFWFGSLFVQQIRDKQKSYPFLEIVGEPGTGKSTLLEFLWKLFGRRDYEGFDPSKSTLSGRTRNFAQLSNLPVVLIEGDRGDGKDAKQKRFDWDELKTAYNGRSIRTKGLKNAGNDTCEPPFRGSIVIAQNADVQASDAILQRIVHLKTDRKHHNAQSKSAADWLGKVPTEQVSGFMVKSLLKEQCIVETILNRTKVYEQQLADEADVCHIRVILNHAQICSLVDALSIVASLSDEQRTLTKQHIFSMAKERQQAINSDHPYVQEFWDVYDFIESEGIHTLNHARDSNLIAINFNHFIELATERKQRVPPLLELKRLLKAGVTHKFLGQKSVNSAVNAEYNKNSMTNHKPLSVKCWVFAK